MKKTISFLLALALFLSLPVSAKAATNNALKINAKSSILISMDTGDVLYESNAHERLSPASVTKIMSLLLVFEAIDCNKIKLTDEVSASENAVEKGGSQIWLEVGEIMSVEELLKAVIVASANDACTALGEYIAGSETAFVKMMNDRAKELGLKDTNFENCTGLDDTVTNHYSSAYDLAIISMHLMEYKLIQKYSKIWLEYLRDGKTELNNTNKLVNKYKGITGLKTGTTSAAGFCISATATRNNMSLCAVVLGGKTSEDRFNGAKSLLDWGFANYALKDISAEIKNIENVKVNGGIISSFKPICNSTKIIVDNNGAKLKFNYEQKDKISAPVKKGEVVGSVRVICNNKEIKKFDLVCDKDIGKKSFKFLFKLIFSTIGA